MVDEQEIDLELVDIAEDLEMEGVAIEVEANITEVMKMITVDKIVDSFVDNAFRLMNPQEEAEKDKCHDCGLKEEVIVEHGKLIDDREAKLIEKAATVSGLGLRVKKLSVDNAALKKKIKLTDKLRTKIANRDKEISNLKVAIDTKDKLLAFAKVPTAEVAIEAVVKKCKKCPFTAPNMGVLGLHMENDHQYEFECEDCGNKFPFKNQLKLIFCL